VKHLAVITSVLAMAALSNITFASQANNTVITIGEQTEGPTPFISQLTLTASDTTVIASIQFTVAPKPGSVTRPLSGTYSRDDLIARGALNEETGEIFLPVYGLYDGFTNTVTLTYVFVDGSSGNDFVSITTPVFDDPCNYKQPTVLQPRSESTALTYDYVFIRGRCSDFSPTIIDTDGALRWVGPAGISASESIFFHNAFYIIRGVILYRIDLDGTVTNLHSYSGIALRFHHNIDPGKEGFILEFDSTSYYESMFMEVDTAGNILKTWNMADIISAAMVAGGDDPGQFVYSSPIDWFHNNAVTYDKATDSLIVSSRENFVVSIDYETSAINWILGDMTKHWHEFSSLAAYTLALAPDSLPPIGQHAVSITYDQDLFLLDNGFNSNFQSPPGINRDYISPRKYQIDVEARTATEVWNFEMDQSILSPICGSVYEDAPLNYLVDYAFVGGFGAAEQFAQIVGLDASGELVFYYQYPANVCDTAYNSVPLHLESTKFPAIEARPLNISTRGVIGVGDNSLIGGFVVTGNDSKKVVLRALGPSLADSGLAGTAADPVLTLFDSAGNVIATNDNWESGADSSEIETDGLAPSDPAEAALVQTLTPGAYTIVSTTKENSPPGIGLVEAYDLSPLTDSKLANLSTRGFVGTSDQVLISGFIVGDVASSTVVIRALGPSLGSAGLSDPLSDPILTLYDQNAMAIAVNDNWQGDVHAPEVESNGLSPSNDTEAALILHLPPGSYTTILSGAAQQEGVGLVEVYHLP